MRNRKGFLALLMAGLVIVGLSLAFNGSLAAEEKLKITTESLPDATLGKAYSQSLSATGGTAPYIWSRSMFYDLPTGLNFSPDGKITGTVAAISTPKDFLLRVKVTDSPKEFFPQTVFKNLKLTVVTNNDVGNNENELAMDFSGLKAGTAGRPYSGTIKANNAAKRPFWQLGTNNLSDFGLTAPASSYGSSFTIRSINSTSAKEGTATGTITLKSRIGKNENDEITGDFKIEIKKGGGGGSGIIAPKIASFTFDNGKKSIRVTEGDSVTFKWSIANATSMEIKGRLAPQSDQDPAGQKNICEENSEGCKLPAGELKVKISRSSAFSLRATNTQDGKSKTTTSAVYVIVTPVKKKFGTLVVEGKLNDKSYTGRIVPVIGGNEQSGEDVWRFFKDGSEDRQGNLNIKSLPKVFNRTIGKWELKIDSSVEGFKLFSPVGKKISASLQSISPNGGELKSGGTIRFGLNFKISDDNGGGGLTITTASFADGTVGAAYSQSLSATGGTVPYTWSIISGKLPAGLTLNSAGLLSGTPTKADSKTFKIKVVDSSSPKKSKIQQFALAVKNTSTEVKYSCNSQGSCVADPTGLYGNSSCDNACTPPAGGGSPDLGRAYNVLQKVSADIRSCPTWPFMDEAIKQLRVFDSRWGYHNYPKTKSSLVVSQDRIAWYSGSGEPVNGSNQVLAYDIISGYCTSKAKLRKPSLVHSSEFNYKDQWKFPREKSSMVETPELAELEIGTVTPTPNLALVEDVVALNKSLIAQGLDAVDSIVLPAQFYTEKFFRDALSVSFWKKVKKSLELKKLAPKRKLKSTPSPTK